MKYYKFHYCIRYAGKAVCYGKWAFDMHLLPEACVDTLITIYHARGLACKLRAHKLWPNRCRSEV